MSQICPHCITEIPDRATTCRACGAWKATEPPPNVAWTCKAGRLVGYIFGPISLAAGLLDANGRDAVVAGCVLIAVAIFCQVLLKKTTRTVWHSSRYY